MSKPEYKLSDQVIGQIRELLQLALLTRTNFVDHMRSLRLEESEKTEGSMILTESYVEGWNKMGEQFMEQAQMISEQMASTIVGAEPANDNEVVTESESEVVISRDPETGKLVGTRQKTVN